MKKLSIAALLLCSSFPCLAQLTQDQKVADFKGLVGLYDKNYGPYQWKIKAFDYDLLKIEPWLDQVYASTDDLSFYDICVRYVASLHDFHDEFTLPSLYEAYLPLTADIYDGKVLIDYVDTLALPPASFPISIGDEIVSVDGVSVQQWITELAPYSVNGEGNPVSRDRLAVATMLDRYQGWYTYANKVKPGQVAIVKTKGTKGTATYEIPWQVIFGPLRSEGPVPNPSAGFGGHGRSWRSMRETARYQADTWNLSHGKNAASNAAPATTSSSSKSDLVHRMRDFGHLHPAHVLAGGLDPFGSLYPLFNPPPGFKLRLGNPNTDDFLSGTFPVGTSTVGFIRIPSFAGRRNVCVEPIRGRDCIFSDKYQRVSGGRNVKRRRRYLLRARDHAIFGSDEFPRSGVFIAGDGELAGILRTERILCRTGRISAERGG